MSADFTPEKEDYKILTPFKMQVLTNFPYIEADFDALTNYQLLCKVVEYLNNVITNENEVTEQVTSLYNAYVLLQNYVNHYFDSLDLQTLVDNKLDEMAESGELADMIAEYIKMQGQLVYNTVAEMKEAENIQNGSFLKTYGFYDYKDGGGALYKARTITNEDVIDNCTIIALHDNTLVAELITNGILYIKQFGAYGDDTHNDLSAINKAISYAKSGDTLYFTSGTYLVDDTIHIDRKDLSIKGDPGSIIKASSAMTDLFDYRFDNTMLHNRELNGLTFDGNALVDNVLVLEAMSLRVENILVLNPIEKGVYLTHRSLQYGVVSETFINNLTVINRLITENYNGIGVYVDTSDSSLSNIVTVNMHIGIYAKDGANYFYNLHPWISNTNIFPNSYGIYNTGYGNSFNSCYLDTCFYGIYSNVDTYLIGGNFKIVNSFYEGLSANPIFIYGEPRDESYDYPTITAISCYFENDTNKTYNPYISNTKTTCLINPRRHPSNSLFFIADNLNDYIPFRKDKFYRLNFGSLNVGANSAFDAELNVPDVHYDDFYTWSNVGNYFPDGVIPTVYLKNGKVTIRLYNTTSSQVTVNASILLTLKTNINNSVIERTTIS